MVCLLCADKIGTGQKDAESAAEEEPVRTGEGATRTPRYKLSLHLLINNFFLFYLYMRFFTRRYPIVSFMYIIILYRWYYIDFLV